MLNGTHLNRFMTFMLFLGISMATHSVSFAEEITSSKVFQVTEDILAQLNRMHDANLTKPDFSKVRLEIPERLPRHVIQQAMNVRLKIQTLKRVNALEVSEVATPPVKEVTPEDVLGQVNLILEDLIAFDKSYALPAFKKSAKFVDGKTPTDVYANLLKAQAMIVQLGIPDTVPNEVYNNAVSLAKEIDFIRHAQGKMDPVEPPSASIGKQPSDAYTLAYYALKGLMGLAKKKEYTIPKGVIVPKRLKKDITPDDVQQILLYCLAEASAMKVAVGAKDKLILPPPTAGQTPSSTFDELGLINRQIQSMQW